MRLSRCLLTVLASIALVACGGGGDSADDAADSGPAMKLLNGTVSYRERMALPVNATISVRLLDISLQDVPARVLAEETISAQGKSVPIPYTLSYDPNQVQEGLSYAVRAAIRSPDGRLLWTTDTVHPVLTRGAPMDNVEIRVVRVNSAN